MKNYSIIIPHKNVPDLLKRCISSIPPRNDTEIIVVDDSSNKDVSKLHQLESELRNSNVRFCYLKEPHGAGFARNTGISMAKGKWLLFADADDFYTDNLSFILDKYANNTTTDIVYLNAQYYYDDGKTRPIPFSRYIERYLRNKYYSEEVLKYNMWTPWTRMVKRDLVTIHNLKFEEVPVSNDRMFCLKCSQYSKTIAAERAIIYNYYQSKKGSLTTLYRFDPETIKMRLEVILRANKLYDEVGYRYKTSYIYNYYRNRNSIKTKKARKTYSVFFREHSISIYKDFCNMLIEISGKLFRII